MTPDKVASLSLYQFSVFKKQAYIIDYIEVASAGIKQEDFDALVESENIRAKRRKNKSSRVERMEKAIRLLHASGNATPSLREIEAKMVELQQQDR